MERYLRYFKDPESLANAAAREIAAMLVEAVEARGRATLALAGGSTPKPVYERLARVPGVPWGQVDIFLGDERMAPADSELSNMRMVQDHLLGQLDRETPRVHAVDTRLAPAEAASAYASELAEVLGPGGAVPGSGHIDLVLLGMGPDGHTASLFPGAAAMQDNALVAAVRAEEMAEGVTPRVDRVTFTPRVLNEARCAMYLIMDEDKLALFRAMEAGESGAVDLPAARIAPQECLIWYLLQP
ncbi:6-phosphogluconolactonase [Oceanidesulfovibrio indonesiensis]|uniref:6-phosphogluconolactonase n=1 Tax=Oceanidesulfovibrio indonesiensis TaxID=54767 RepID=UPI00142FE24F|nr:6-phosphogluconolactonase [Oceanidesulfovibrio indonesiensis]